MTGIDILYKLIDNGRAGKNIGLSTGCPKMDKLVGGMQRGLYTLIFGSSGSGKSAWTLYNYIYRPLKDYPDKPIQFVYYSLEMSESLLLAKLLCLYIYEEFGDVISYSELMSWQRTLSDNKYNEVKHARKWLESVIPRLTIFDKSLSAPFFYASLKSLLLKWGTEEEIENGNSKRTVYFPKDPDQLVFVVCDHLGLSTPTKGHTKKEEIDTISAYAVTFREKYQVSFFMLMQENRNSADMDRRKAELTECTAEDIKDSGNVFNDCEVCIGIYNPLRFKLKTHKKYPIIIEGAGEGQFGGLRDRYRAACLLKNRQGEADKIIPLNFFGELGVFRELPKPDQITDYTQFLTLNGYKETEQKDSSTPQREEEKKPITFSF